MFGKKQRVEKFRALIEQITKSHPCVKVGLQEIRPSTGRHSVRKLVWRYAENEGASFQLADEKHLRPQLISGSKPVATPARR